MSDEHDVQPVTGQTINLKDQPLETIQVTPAASTGPHPLLMALLAIGFSGLVLFCIFGLLVESKPEYPAPAINASQADFSQYWKNYPYWLSINEHYQLRQSEEVYNLAYFDANTVRFSKYSIPINDRNWNPNNSDVVFSYKVTGTVVTITDSNFSYVLNTYEPFVFSHTPDKIFVVVPEGGLWVMNASLNHEVLESAAGNSVHIRLPANSNLSQ